MTDLKDRIRPLDGIFVGTPFEGVSSIEDFRDGSEMKADLAICWDENSNVGLALARAAIHHFDDAVLTIAFDEYGIWPSFEDRYLVRALYKFCLGLDDVNFSVGVDFPNTARDAATSFLHVAIQQGWGGVLFSRSRREWFSFDHDAHGWLKTDQKSDWPSENKLPWLKVTAMPEA